MFAMINERAVPITAEQWDRARRFQPIGPITGHAARRPATASALPPVDARALSRASMVAEATRMGMTPKSAAAPALPQHSPHGRSGATASIPGDHVAMSRASMIAQVKAAGMKPKI